MTEHEFCAEVLGEAFEACLEETVGLAGRPRLIKAFRKLLKKADTAIDCCDITIFAPGPDCSGMFMLHMNERVIYISPMLDLRSQAWVDYTVAHEFAHAVCEACGEVELPPCVCGKREDCNCFDCECEGCKAFEMSTLPDSLNSPEEYVNSPEEYAADSLVLAWGYELPAWKAKLRKVPHGE